MQYRWKQGMLPMNNYQNLDNQYRRFKAHVSPNGTIQIHLRNPYIVAWWSAALPGFGHLMLNKNVRGLFLFIWEVFVNYQAKLNLAMVYTFCGHYELAKATLDTRWALMYIPVYLFSIWDSYRTCVDLNKVYILAEREDSPFNSFSISPLEINYLDKRSPLMTIIWSLFMPGLGQLHLHRNVIAFFSLIWTIVFLFISKALVAVHLLFFGEIQKSTAVLNIQWLLFMPSMWGFAVYDSYISTVEMNKLFDSEQKKYLRDNYQHPSFKIRRGKVAGY